MAVPQETARHAIPLERLDAVFDFGNVRDPQLGEFLQAVHDEVLPDLGNNRSLRAVVRELGGFADTDERFDDSIARFIRNKNVIPLDGEKRVPQLGNREVFGVAAVVYALKLANPSYAEGIVWEGYEGERGIVGEARYRLGENPLRDILTDPYPLSEAEEATLAQKGQEAEKPALSVDTAEATVKNDVVVELPIADITLDDKNKKKVSDNNEKNIGEVIANIHNEDLRVFLQTVSKEIIGDRSIVAKQDLFSPHALQVLGSNKPYLENLLRNLDISGLLKYEVQYHENGKGRPKHVYRREKMLILGAIIRRVGKKADYGDVNWKSTVEEVRSDLGENNSLNAFLYEPNENETERKVTNIYHTDSDAQARRINTALRIQQEDLSNHPAMAFSDDQLLQLWVDYRKLPNVVDELDAAMSRQYGISEAQVANVVRLAFGNEKQLDTPVTLLQYRSAIARILDDAHKAERLEPLRRKLAEEMLAEIEQAPRAIKNEQEDAEKNRREHLIYMRGIRQMPATFVDALEADYETIFASKAHGRFTPDRFGLTSETYDYILRATEIIIARSHGHEPSFSHLFQRKPDTEDVRGALAVVSHYMKQHGITSYKELYDRIH